MYDQMPQKSEYKDNYRDKMKFIFLITLFYANAENNEPSSEN